MTTIVNTPAPTTENSSGGFIIGAIVLVGFVAVLLYFGIPAVSRMGTPQINVPAPQVNVPAPQVVLPNKIDVNVVQPK